MSATAHRPRLQAAVSVRASPVPCALEKSVDIDEDDEWFDQGDDCGDGSDKRHGDISPPAYREADHRHHKYDHRVQFYECDEHLYNVITSFLAPCFGSKHAVIIVATQKHLDALELRFLEQRVNIEDKKRSMQVTMIEADYLLSKMMPHGILCRRAFDYHVGRIVRAVHSRYQKIFAYGEMVNVLCCRENHKTALQLEGYWNAFLQGKELNLLCGYDLNTFKNHANRAVFQEICEAHSHIIPTERFSKHKTQNQQAAAVAALEQKAKALDVEVARRRATELALQDALNLLSSLADEPLSLNSDTYSLLFLLPVGLFGALERSEAPKFFSNQRFREITGLSELQLRESGFLLAVHPDDRPKITANWMSWNRGEGFYGKLEYRFTRPDGQICWVTGETVANVKGYIHTVADITEVKRMEQEKLSAQRAAEEFQRQRALEAERHKRNQEEFVDTLCHELRNPLGAIIGNVELLLMGLDTRSKILSKSEVNAEDLKILRRQLNLDAESLGAMEKCVAHQKVISDDVLNLSKLELEKVVLQNISFEPKAVITSVAKMFEAQARKKGMDLHLDLPDVDFEVMGDPDRLRQVVINLLANSIKFTENGWVTVGLDIKERNADHAVLRIKIQDTGVGMTEKEKASLFNKFEQLSSVTSAEYGGSGLGLYISKCLVELMGGRIEVESVKGEGTQFSFTFRCTEVHREPAFSNSGLSASSATERSPLPAVGNVLVVEDNLINQRFMSRLLEAAGYRCALACNGKDAVDMVASTQFDVVVMDLEMPVMNGIEATTEIRRLESNTGVLLRVPIIGLSGNARYEHRIKSISAGMDEYLTKPVRKEEILSVIRRHLPSADARH